MQKTMFLEINMFGLCENARLPWQPVMRFSRMGDIPTNSIIPELLLIIDYLTLYKVKA